MCCVVVDLILRNSLLLLTLIYLFSFVSVVIQRDRRCERHRGVAGGVSHALFVQQNVRTA